MNLNTPSLGTPGLLDDTKIRSLHGLATFGGPRPTSSLCSDGLPDKDRDGKPVSTHTVANLTVQGSQGQQTSDFHRDIVKMLLIRKNLVQERRSQLLAQGSSMRELWSELEKLADRFVLVAQRQLIQADPSLKLLDLLEPVKDVQKEMRSRGRAYDTVVAKLHFEEAELVATETELYQTFELPSFHDEVSKSSSASSPTAEMLHATNQHQSPRPPNPLYNYERKIGLANHLHERILDMISDRAEILEEQRQLSSGSMEQEDVHFLETYDELFADRVKELDAVEAEISRLEKDAIDTGLLSPSAIYSRTRPWAADSLFLGPPAIDLTDKRSGVNPVIAAPAELPDSEQPTVAPMSQSPTPLRSGSYIRRWLSGLPLNFMPVSPGHGFCRLWSQICPGSEEKTGQLQNARRASSISGGPIPEPIEKGWVHVVQTGSEREYPQNMAYPGGKHLHSESPEIEDSPDHIVSTQRLSDPGFSSNLPYPNKSHQTPLRSLDNARTSRSL